MSRKSREAVGGGGSDAYARLLPAAEVLVESPAASHSTPRQYGLLVVDDEEGVRDMVSVWMRRQGFAVWLAAEGQEALALYRQHSQAIDMVLMDVRMPGLDGPQVLVALQEINPRIRCCFMSGDFGRYAEWRLCNLGATAVFRKPFRPAEVAELLWELVSNADWRRPS